jgi:protein-L-isoaspartate(D-aspartate) O-methyltransferase
VTDKTARNRRALLREIEIEMRETAPYTGRPALSPRVLEALATVPRERFVPEGESSEAYINAPLPIGHGQTISQPYIVALMTDLLDPEPNDVVLEVGTGSGYQAAVLSRLVRRVYSLEVVEPLAADAAARLKALGYGNVEVRHGDGHHGWPEHAPYDKIMVTAATPEIPPALVMQLDKGGRMVVPVGRPFYSQELMLLTKNRKGVVHERPILPVAFVPLTHGAERG